MIIKVLFTESFFLNQKNKKLLHAFIFGATLILNKKESQKQNICVVL